MLTARLDQEYSWTQHAWIDSRSFWHWIYFGPEVWRTQSTGPQNFICWDAEKPPVEINTIEMEMKESSWAGRLVSGYSSRSQTAPRIWFNKLSARCFGEDPLLLTWLTRLPPKFSSLSLSSCNLLAQKCFKEKKVHLGLFQLALLLLLLPGTCRVWKVVEKAARLKQLLCQAPVFQLLLPKHFLIGRFENK